MSSPLVSIVIPCFNHESFVRDSIQSVIDQNYENIELIIIDDGSQDNSIEIIKSMVEKCKKRFIRFEFRCRPNKGLSITLNEALSWCQGQYYSAIASDDIMLPEKTSIQVSFLNNNKEVDGVFGNASLINEYGLEINKAIPSKRKLTFKNIILSNYTIIAASQMIRMMAIRNLGESPYPIHIKIEDWYMWLKLSEGGSLVNINKDLVKYRVHSNNSMKNIDLINESRIQVINEFSHSVFYDRGLSLVKLINYLDKHKNLPISLVRKHPTMVLDVLTHKKILQFLLGKFDL